MATGPLGTAEGGMTGRDSKTWSRSSPLGVPISRACGREAGEGGVSGCQVLAQRWQTGHSAGFREVVPGTKGRRRAGDREGWEVRTDSAESGVGPAGGV